MQKQKLCMFCESKIIEIIEKCVGFSYIDNLNKHFQKVGQVNILFYFVGKSNLFSTTFYCSIKNFSFSTSVF